MTFRPSHPLGLETCDGLVRVRVPKSLVAACEAAAQASGVWYAEWVRQALAYCAQQQGGGK